MPTPRSCRLERPCPICGQKMRPEVYFGIEIDTCPEHGLWLDNGELETIVAAVQSADRTAVRRVVKWTRRDGQFTVALLGICSLLD